MRTSRHLACLALAALAFALAPCAAAVKPDAEAARAFGAELYRAFAQDKSAALLDRFDADAFEQSVFREPPPEDPAQAANRRKGPIPGVTDVLRLLDRFSTLAYFRVVLDGDQRELECDFARDDGDVQTFTFMLSETPSGKVRIADFAFGGDPVPQSQAVRLSLLMQGIAMPHLHTPEEFDVERLGHDYRGQYNFIAEAFYTQRYDEAWASWYNLPEEVRTCPPCWRFLDLLDRVNKSAHAELRRRIKDGAAVNPFVRLRVALEDGDSAAALQALDAIADERQSPPLYECVRALFLARSGKPAEGLRVVRDVMVLEPLMTFAYLTGVRIAASDRPDEALDFVKLWVRVSKPAAIDAALAENKDLSSFRESAAYRGWLKSVAAGAVTDSPPAPSASRG